MTPTVDVISPLLLRRASSKGRVVLRTPLCDALQDPLKVVARGIFAHRGPWAVAAGKSATGTGASAMRGSARKMTAASAGPPRSRLLLTSQWIPQEALQVQVILYEEAKAAARRWWLRLFSKICGVSVGVMIVALMDGVVVKGRWTHQKEEASHSRMTSSEMTLSRSASGPLLDLLARNLVRKSSRHSIDEVYTVSTGAPLGVGAYGVVHRAKHNRSGVERAVKLIDKQGISDRAMLTREVEALRILDHPNICRLIEYFETDRHLWLVLELCSGEELCDRLINLSSGVPEMEASQLMGQMLRATLHCHRRSVLHRDLKPENFLYKDTAKGDGDVLKLVDFGFCSPPAASVKASFLANLPTSGARQSAGTVLYRSPQALRGDPPTFSDDAWSLGVIFHILLTGHFPFSTNDDAHFLELSKRKQLQRDVNDHLAVLPASGDAVDLATRLLAFDPAERISIESALRHPFVRTEFCQSDTAMANSCLDADSIYNRCGRFLRLPRLRRIALAVAARSLSDEERWKSARDAFIALDRRGDGVVRRDELRSFLAKGGLFPPSSWFASLSNGWPALASPHPPYGISYTAFVAMAMDDAFMSGDERLARIVFDLLDVSHDGSLTKEDLCLRLGLSPHHAEQCIDEALASVGVDRSLGAVSFSAFQQLMRISIPQEASDARVVKTNQDVKVAAPSFFSALSREDSSLTCIMSTL